MNIQILATVAAIAASIAAIIGGFYAVVTRPMMLLFKAELGTLRAEMKGEFASVRAEMKEMEARLNQRIDTRLVHR